MTHPDKAIEGIFFDWGDLQFGVSDKAVEATGNFLMTKEQNKAMKQIAKENAKNATAQEVNASLPVEEESGKGVGLLLIGVVLLMVLFD